MLCSFIQPVRLSAPCPLAAFFRRWDKLHSESGVPTLSAPPETEHDLRTAPLTCLEIYSCVYVCACAPTLRHVSMFSVLALLSGSGSNMSTFKQHDKVLQEEHTPDWYFQSAGLAVLWNSQWHWYDWQQACAACFNQRSFKVWGFFSQLQQLQCQ